MSTDTTLVPADFTAALTNEQVKTYGAPDRFVYERMVALQILTRSGPELLESLREADDPGDVLMTMLDTIGAGRKHLEALLSLTLSAEARVHIVAQNLAEELEGPASNEG